MKDYTYIEARAAANTLCERGEQARIKRDGEHWVAIITRPAVHEGKHVLARRDETIGPVHVA